MMPDLKYDVIIAGAGAAGLIAAGRAALSGKKVLLLEKMRQPGRKLRITGKGRCNITNSDTIDEFIKHIHPKGRFLKHAFLNFFSKDIIKLFEELGVETVLERGGRIFPKNGSAPDVVRALEKWVKDTNCDIQLNSRLTDLIIENGTAIGVKIRHNGKIESIFSDFVLMCTGGCSYPATGSDGSVFKILKDLGHEIVNLRPSLVPIETAGGLAKSLMGLSLKNVRAVVWVNGKKQAEDFGEMIFTHFGLSGPIILTLSRIAVDALLKGTEVEISIDLKPALDEQKLDKRLQRDLNEHGKKQIENIFKMLLPSKMIPVFLDELKINPGKLANQVSSRERRKIRMLMKDLRFKVTGYRSFDEAIITAGGVSTNEIHSKTMESKLIKNLYFAGEMIDLDADTGGYNLQIAYSTAWLAAGSCGY